MCIGLVGERESFLTLGKWIGLLRHTHQGCWFEWVFLLESFCIGTSRVFFILHLFILKGSLIRKLSFLICTRNMETLTHSLYSKLECSFQDWYTLFQKLIFRCLLRLLSSLSHWIKAVWMENVELLNFGISRWCFTAHVKVYFGCLLLQCCLF